MHGFIILFFVFAFLVGLAVGSFLTVVVDRIATGEQIVWGRSHCPHCRKPLHWFELLPVVSFLVQGGQCRTCKNRIPYSYLVIELVTSLLFMGIAAGLFSRTVPIPEFLRSGIMPFPSAGILAASFLFYSIVVGFSVAISLYDLEHRLIPRSLILPLIVLGGGVTAIAWIGSHDTPHLVVALGTAAFAFALFWGLWFFSGGRAMGRGDADVALAIALVLGPTIAILGFLFAFWSGSLYGIVGIAARRLRFKSEIPFAPFLFGGGIGSLFLSSFILSRFPFFG